MPEQKNKEIFESVPIPKALAILAIPTIIGQLVVLVSFYVYRRFEKSIAKAAG